MKYKSQVYTEASGSIGGITYSHNAAGLYTRARAIPTNPNSPEQQAVKAAMNFLADRWDNTLTAAQRTGWETYAANVGMYDKLGAVIYLSGLNHYIRSNTINRQRGLPVSDDAPAVFNIGNLSVPTTSNFVAGPPSRIDITYSILDDWYLVAGGQLHIFASRPQLKTINYFKGPYRFAQGIPSLVAPPATVTLPFNIVAGQRIFLRARAMCSDARTSVDVFFRHDA